jgi:hypothetical protein
MTVSQSKSRYRAILERLEERFVPSAACPTDPVSQAECAYLLRVFPDASATDVVLKSGNWDDPTIWSAGHVPTATDWVLIPQPASVTIASTDAVARIVSVRGALTFATNVNTALRTDTIVTWSASPDDGGGPGYLTIGTAQNPVQAGVHCTITFMDDGPINTAWDPKEISRGLVAHGVTSIWGSTVTPFVALAAPAYAGATTLTLAQLPTDWHVGDRLELAGTQYGQSESARIAALSGTTVTVAVPLAYSHVPYAGQQTFVADEHRNVTFLSQNTASPSRSGHVMFMHSDMVSLGYVAFDEGGRTDKSVPLNDAQLDPSGQLVPGTGSNDRGRYELHFHRCGGIFPGTQNYGDPPIQVIGLFLGPGPGWGAVNHDSDVVFTDCVAVGLFGAGFIAESGDEIGAFNGCLAVGMHGSSEIFADRPGVADFGFEGEGYWMQSPGVALTHDVAADCRYGFAEYNLGLQIPGDPIVTFAVAQVPDPQDFAGQITVSPSAVPLGPNGFVDNTAYAGFEGLEVRWHLQLVIPGLQHSTWEGFTAWNVSRGVNINSYVTRSTFDDLTLLEGSGGPGSGPGAAAAAGVGVNSSPAYNAAISLTGADIEGFQVGYVLPGRGTNVVNGGTFNNVTNFQIGVQFTALGSGRVIQFNGPILFGPLSQLDYFLDPQLNTALTSDRKGPDPNGDFVPEQIILPDGRELYYANQVPSYVPFPLGHTPSFIPPALVGLTVQELWDLYGLAPEGAVAPAGSVTDQSTNGLIGPAQAPLNYYRLTSAVYAPAGSSYTLTYRLDVPGGPSYTDLHPVILLPGWQVITRVGPDGLTHSWLVDGAVSTV